MAIAGENTSLPYRLYRLFWVWLDILYPPQCAGCSETAHRWCPNCQMNTRLVTAPICERCGAVTNGGVLCSRCEAHEPHYRSVRSWAYFDGPVRNAIHRLKYKRDISLGDTFAAPLAKLVLSLDWPLDLIVPMPLSRSRHTQRGYNQAALLARPLAWLSGVACRENAVIRSKDTTSQVGLSLEERRLNVKNAFVASSKFVKGRTVLLVDDVMTTGATMDACALALLEGGATDVYGLTMARAMPNFEG